MLPKFRLARPGLWRPPFTTVSLRDVVIKEVPPGATDVDQYGNEDLLEFLNRTQKFINETHMLVSRPDASETDKSSGLYLVSRLQIELVQLAQGFSKQFPDYTITFHPKDKGVYSIVPKAFVSGFQRR